MMPLLKALRLWARRGAAVGLCLAIQIMPLPVHAQVDSREGIALQNQLYQLRQDIQVLREQVRQGGGGGGTDVAAQLLSRVQSMEEQVRGLRGRIDETQNMMNRHNADLAKRIDDLTFQLNLPGRQGAAPPLAPQPMQGSIEPPRVREVAPRPPPAEIRPVEVRPPEAPPARLALPMPTVVPPASSPPPQSFTFNPAPEPMREARPVAPAPPLAVRIEPARTVPPVVAATSAIPAAAVPAVTRPTSPAPAPPPPVAEGPLDPNGKRTPELALQEGQAALARRDYASAERSAREVMVNRTSPRAYDGQFLLAQALVGQRQFAQAAIAFDDTYNRSHKGRHAQDALLGLAGALTVINEKRAACDTLGRLRSEFPQVRADLKDSITKTNDRAGCAKS